MATKDVLGKHGEQLAADYLEQRGYVVLSRNWRCRDGEIDIIATDRNRLVVCEVKTRSGGQFGAPAEAVTKSKAWRIRRVTQVWMAEYRVRWCEARFDVLAVLMPPDGRPVVQHYESAF